MLEGRKVECVLVLFLIKEILCFQIIKFIKSSGTHREDQQRATDGDIFTFVQTDKGENESISAILDQQKVLTCFNIIITEGNYDVFLGHDNSTLGRKCRSFHLKGNPLSTFTVQFCCDKGISGKIITIKRIGLGYLRVHEFEISDCPQFKISNKCRECISSCNECLQVQGTCISCEDDIHVGECRTNCSKQCAKGYCENGICSHCTPGYSGVHCKPCKPGKQGVNCKLVCPKGCKYNCHNVEGTCGVCDEGFYGLPYCNKLCNKTMKNCKICSHSKFCDKCSDGWYGRQCKKLCPQRCSTCRNSTFCTSCQSGYSGEMCSLKCPDSAHCELCKNDSICDICSGPWRKKQCQCSAQCNGRCSDDGVCIDHCLEGWFGMQCNQTCSQRCRKCIGSANNCTECHEGYIPHCNGVSNVSWSRALTISSVAIIVTLILIILLIKRIKDQKKSEKIDLTHSNAEENREEHAPDNFVPQHAFGDEENSIFLEEIKHVEHTIPDETQTLNAEYTNTISHRISVDQFIDEHYRKRRSNCFEEDEFASLPTGLLELYVEALKKENMTKNRYKYVYPYDFCRVELITSEGVQKGNDYINASFVEGFHHEQYYIAAQGPFTPEMLIDFWRMVWQKKCSNIVMLTNIFEGQCMKCLKYWPNNEIEIGSFKIHLESQDVEELYTIRNLIVQKNDEVKKVTQFHFTDWPDCGVPSKVDSLLFFRDLVKNSQSESNGPIVIHCSAGIGRTGTFIALD